MSEIENIKAAHAFLDKARAGLEEMHVFPQTVTWDEKFKRTGGLTKRELVAASVLSNSYIYNDNEVVAKAVAFAFKIADEFIKQSNARKA